MKIGFNNLSIKYKIVIIVTFLFFVTFATLSVFIYLYSKKEFLENAKNEISIIGKITVENIAGAVAFHDKEAIDQVLSSLKLIQELQYVEVLDTNGNIISNFSATHFENEKLLNQLRNIDSTITKDLDYYFVIVRPVTFHDQKLGKLIMVYGKSFFFQKFVKFIVYEFFIFFAILLLAFILIIFLQNIITGPILELISTMKKVIDNNDFTIRLKPTSKDEFGTMIYVFNHMLHHIELQNKVMAEAQQKALQHAKIKELFLAHMSHEIRTPLNAIYGFTVLLEETNLSDTQKLYLHYIKSSIENLQVIINDILDFSKIEAGKLKIEKHIFDLPAFLNEVKQIFLPKAKDKKIDLLLEIDPQTPQYVIGDKIRLNQVLINLIGNAIKFTETGYVKIHLKVKDKTNKKVTLVFSVIDTGIGIKKDQLDIIFEEFQQADNDISVKYGGTGLGLAISRKLIELQNGKMFVQSEYRKGSTFGFEITYELPDENQIREYEKQRGIETEPKEEKQDYSGLKVLIVEDNKINQILLKKILSKHNIETVIAANGKEAISAVEKENFDIIFMDIHMPEMNGYEATEYIKTKIENVVKRQIPVVALTAAVTDMEKNKAEKVGMVGFIAKPFKEQDILEIINKFVKNS